MKTTKVDKPVRVVRDRSKPVNLRMDNLIVVDPMTTNQKNVFKAFKHDNQHLILSGSAGTGKTFIGMYLALEQILDKKSQQDKLIIVRSVVPTREVGFLPGTIDEKLEAYKAPYKHIAGELFERGDAYDILADNNTIEFISTSFIRGITLDNCIIMVDECQNLNFHELDSIITRVGINSRIIFSGDYYQSDFAKESDRKGVDAFFKICEQLRNFTHVEFNWQDIVRSDFVRDYIMTKEMMEKENK